MYVQEYREFWNNLQMPHDTYWHQVKKSPASTLCSRHGLLVNSNNYSDWTFRFFLKVVSYLQRDVHNTLLFFFLCLKAAVILQEESADLSVIANIVSLTVTVTATRELPPGEDAPGRLHGIWTKTGSLVQSCIPIAIGLRYICMHMEKQNKSKLKQKRIKSPRVGGFESSTAQRYFYLVPTINISLREATWRPSSPAKVSAHGGRDPGKPSSLCQGQIVLTYLAGFQARLPRSITTVLELGLWRCGKPAWPEHFLKLLVLIINELSLFG